MEPWLMICRGWGTNTRITRMQRTHDRHPCRFLHVYSNWSFPQGLHVCALARKQNTIRWVNYRCSVQSVGKTFTSKTLSLSVNVTLGESPRFWNTCIDKFTDSLIIPESVLFWKNDTCFHESHLEHGGRSKRSLYLQSSQFLLFLCA